MNIHELTVFFPCFNEEGNIADTVHRAVKYLNGRVLDFQLVIIDDGSTDATGRIAERLAAEDARIEVVHHDHNRGYGAALRSGFAHARKDYVFFTDGDGQFDIHELGKLVALIDRYDIVTGFRVGREDPFLRTINAWLWTALVNVVFGVGVRDINCAFKLYRRSVFTDMPLISDGACINTEIYARARKRGCTIAQVDVHHYPRRFGTQTGANPGVILKAFKELWSLRKELR